MMIYPHDEAWDGLMALSDDEPVMIDPALRRALDAATCDALGLSAQHGVILYVLATDGGIAVSIDPADREYPGAVPVVRTFRDAAKRAQMEILPGMEEIWPKSGTKLN